MSQKNHLVYLDLDVDSLDINRTQKAQLKRLISCIKPNLSKIQRNLERVKAFTSQMEQKNNEIAEENEAYCAIIDSILEQSPVAVTPDPQPVQEVSQPVETPATEPEKVSDANDTQSAMDDFFGEETTAQTSTDTIENPFML